MQIQVFSILVQLLGIVLLFNCCVCLKSSNDRGLFCLEVFGVSKRVSESCGLQGYLFVCVVIWNWLLVELRGFLRTGCSSV